MATVSWTKEWAPSDDGTILRGVDLANIQDDIDTWISGNSGDFVTRTTTQTISGDKTFSGVLQTTYIYFGDPTVDGTWRITTSGNNLVRQRRESGSWVTKGTDTP